MNEHSQHPEHRMITDAARSHVTHSGASRHLRYREFHPLSMVVATVPMRLPENGGTSPAMGGALAGLERLSPEYLRLLGLCQLPRSVLEIAHYCGAATHDNVMIRVLLDDLRIPVGGRGLREVLSDLLDQGLIHVEHPDFDVELHDPRLYRDLAFHLRALRTTAGASRHMPSRAASGL
ncbi:hypothetical protein Acsp04_54050 [Actinomadura sp. NBRC 104425]|nr:hypothetical protein Acsp04_54050 [Actinomadura sp. NBRC 104425]